MSEKNSKLIRRFIQTAKQSQLASSGLSEADIMRGAQKSLKKKFRDSSVGIRENMIKYMKSIAY